VNPIVAGMVFQDRYEVLSHLGEGGFSQVFRGRQQATGQEVAIKVLRHLHTRDAGHVARFQREMRLCARLYHPHIVRLIDSGQSEPDLLYTVFEYVPGRTLAEVLEEEETLPTWEAVHLMLQVLDALACAHKLGIVHRDLKPQNIMVTSTGVRRNALVLDFGLGVLAAEGRQEELARITQTRDLLGTPAYAAPEQLRGEPVTARADLYAWGLIFLECLTGQRAVRGATVQELIFQQLGEEPIALPEWLEGHRLGRLLRRVTHKDARARTVTAQELLRELEACGTQGWPSPGAARPHAVEDSHAVSASGERRQLTAVCCGVRLERGERETADVEDLDRLLRAQHAVCTQLARRHEASVGGTLGEQLLLYFGYPQAREDDARRAARLALEWLAEMERRGVEARVGLHTGLVISQQSPAHGPGDVPAGVGTTPGRAARLAALARPGEALVSEATAKLLRDAFTLEPTEVRGETPFLLGAELRGRTAAHEAHGPPASRLYGRTLELELLGQRWRQAVAGTGQGILLLGEPGIGKSRLAQELARQLRHTPHTFLECRCAPEGRHSTLRPVVELLEGLLGRGPDWTAERTTAALEALLARHGFDLAATLPLFTSLLSLEDPSHPPPLHVSPQLKKELTLQALLSLLFEMAQQQPVLLVVEDLHWADPTTLELLTLLVNDAPGARLCAVLTARPEFPPPWPAAQALQVQLSRLERPLVAAMVEELTRQAPLPAELMEQVVGRTDGVPLFVEELTRMVMESLPPGETTPTRAAGRLSIPSTLRDSLMARLDRLGPAKATAQLAAALGREFSHEVLEAASLSDAEALKQDLEALVAADLIHRRRGARGPVYAFKHALIQDTAYESMLKPARRQVHARIAVTLELRFPELVQQRPELLARHHAAAEQKREALGYASKAALAALMRSANSEAVEHATEALDWLGAIEEPRERAQLELELNGVIIPALLSSEGFAHETVRARVERSQVLIDQLGAHLHIVPILWALLLYYHSRGQRAQARALSERLLAMALQAEDTGHQVAILPLMGSCLWSEGRVEEARACLSRALALYDVERHRHYVHVYGLEPRAYAGMGLGEVLWALGYPEEGRKHIQAALEWAREVNHASTLTLACIFMATIHLRCEEHEAFARLIEEAFTLASRQQVASQRAYCQVLWGWARRDLEDMKQGLASLKEQGTRLAVDFYESLTAEVEAGLGRHDAALERLEAALRLSRESGELYYVPELLRAQAVILLAREPGCAAGEASLREALALSRALGLRMWELRSAVPLCQLLLERGQSTEARELLAPLHARFTEGDGVPDLVRARALLDVLGG
jgi:TOMM system kinase/cyclase fusion protein